MPVILSQKVDSESSYADELFSLYHYPARYKNQLHEGDTFVYYQGNRYDKSRRYYFGTGTVGKIFAVSSEIWEEVDASSKTMIAEICHRRLKDYFEG